MDWVNSEELRAAGVNVDTRNVLGGDCVLFTIGGGDAAIEIWKRLSSRFREVGGWPILCGSPTDRLTEQFGNSSESIAQQLAVAGSATPLAALKFERNKRRQQTMEYLRANNPALFDTMSRMQDEDPPPESVNFSDWPNVPTSSNRKLHTPYDYKGKPLPECILAVVRVAEPALAPIYLRFGGFNDCPSSAIQVAFLRDWNRRYGAVPAAITTDVIELVLPQPIIDQNEAVLVAREQYAYCADIVEQGTQTVGNLAREIWGSPAWFFWWD